MNDTVLQAITLPGELIVTGRLSDAHASLLALAEQHLPTAASLWFTRAAWLYHAAAQDPATWQAQLLPAIRRQAQEFISAQPAKMNDGGLLIDPEAGLTGVALNALWYNMLMLLATELKGDPVADHFDRLAGRFRRSYLKLYWQGDMLGESGATAPDASQLLAATLTHSAVPRTKQRQLVMSVNKAITADAPILHKIWLAEAVWGMGEGAADSAEEAQTILNRADTHDLDAVAQAELARVRQLLSA